MQNKQVRRRRAVLALLVGASLILLTAYFGESPSSPLHSVQRGVAAVFTPVQKGASKVLSPFRDVAGWVSGTIDARSRVNGLEAQKRALLAQIAELRHEVLEDQQASRLLALDTGYSIRSYDPVSAEVIARDPSLWYQQIKVDAGTDSGVRLHDPVVGPGGLVGDVTDLGSDYSIVTELTDSKFAVGAEIDDPAGDSGILEPAVGDPNSLLLEDLPPETTDIRPSQNYPVVTSGFEDPGNPQIRSYFPAGIPIGYVSDVNENTVLNQQEVAVSPYVDLHHLSVVQILTNPLPPSSERASLAAP